MSCISHIAKKCICYNANKQRNDESVRVTLKKTGGATLVFFVRFGKVD